MDMLLGPGQGLQQQVPCWQQHALVHKQEQLPQVVQQLVQSIRKLDLQPDRRDGGVRVTRPSGSHPCGACSSLRPGKSSPSLALLPAYPLREAGEAVTEPGQVGGTVGREEADCGAGVGPGQLQAGRHHREQVRAAGRQRFF